LIAHFTPRASFTISLPDGRMLVLGPRTLVMGILNVTPDSFADGGRRLDPSVAIADGEQMLSHGADLIDVGGESTRPGAPPLDEAEEWRRIEPVLRGLRSRTRAPISVDTYKASVAQRAIDLGADLVNDVSALTYDPPIAGVVARAGVAVVLMHNRGRSADMYERAQYADVAADVASELSLRVAAAREAGIAADRIILDPGVGFAKEASQSFAVLAGLPRVAAMGRPILCGPSRKSFLTKAIGDRVPDGRVWATAAAVTASVLLGAHIVRVHDVKPMVDVVRVADAIAGQRAEGKGQREGPL
jgi:dihydropteroate synthase